MEQDVEAATIETVMQRRDLIRLGYVEGLDFDAAIMFVCQIVQLGSGTAAYRTNDVPPLLQKLGGHGEAKTA